MCACMQKGCSVGARKWEAPFLFHSWFISPSSLDTEILAPWNPCQEFPGEQKPWDWFCLLFGSHQQCCLSLKVRHSGQLVLSPQTSAFSWKPMLRRMQLNSVTLKANQQYPEKVPWKGRILHTEVLQKFYQFFSAFMLTNYQKRFLVTEFWRWV